ncbi:MAG: class I SAM-dependent methyltransferase [Streptosporangiales bacterium]
MVAWYTKAAVQGLLSVLPDRVAQRTNCAFQTHVTRSLRLNNKYVKRKWRRARWHVDAWREYTGGGGSGCGGVGGGGDSGCGGVGAGDHDTFQAVELGTGWFPITSIGLVLCGAERVITYDVNALASAKTVRSVLKRVNRLIKRGKIVPTSKRARKALKRVLAESRGADAKTMLAGLGIEVRIGDARTSGLTDGSVDLVCSTSTLEHIPMPMLTGLLTEFRRIAGDKTVMSHIIDLSDHYAQVDPSITQFNFLRYSPGRWRLFNNSLHYQNRLRISDYRHVLAETGWEILDEDSSRRPAEELRRVPVHTSFSGYAENDLRVVVSRLITRPAASR